MIPTGNLSIEIDFGSDWPRAILQRKEKGYWHDYLVDGMPVVNPFDVEMLPPGYYRLRDPGSGCFLKEQGCRPPIEE